MIQPFFDSLPVILAVDLLWHGLPFLIVLVSSPLDPEEVSFAYSVGTVGALGGAFLLFSKYIRNIDPGITYGLIGIGGSTPRVLFGIALTSANFYSCAINPASAISGWSMLIDQIISNPVWAQRVSAALLVGGWYFMVLLFGRLPGSSEESVRTREMWAVLKAQIKEMHGNGELGQLLKVVVPKEVTEEMRGSNEPGTPVFSSGSEDDEVRSKVGGRKSRVRTTARNSQDKDGKAVVKGGGRSRSKGGKR